MSDNQRRESVIITPGQSDIDTVLGYKVGKWREHDNYECLRCQYSSIYKEKVEKHIAEGVHDWAFPGEEQRPPEPETPQENGPVY